MTITTTITVDVATNPGEREAEGEEPVMRQMRKEETSEDRRERQPPTLHATLCFHYSACHRYLYTW
jgi:hypothetical protein